jgi:hypothetical protein
MQRTVAWGYGCGGHCAVRNEGSSRVQVWLAGTKARISDEGRHTLIENHEGGGLDQVTTWSYGWQGSARVTATRVRLDLDGKEARCERIEKTREATGESETRTGCPRAPLKLRVECDRAEVVVEGRAHKVWRCRSPKAPPGTVMPWVFGVEEIVDEKVSGEPRPESSYVVRP